MTGFGIVRTWRSAPVTGAGTALSTSAATLDEQLTRLGGTGVGASMGWSGPAAAAAAQRHDELVLRLARLTVAASTLADAVRLAAVRVAAAESLAHQALACAQSAGGHLDDAGRFHDPGAAAGPVGPAGPSASAALTGRPELADLAEVLAARSVAEAELADATLAGVLRWLEPQPTSPPGHRPVEQAPSADGDPVTALGLTAVPAAEAAQRLTWWRGLSPEGQRAAVSAAPELVGGTDGVPGWARDRANRLLLARAVDQPGPPARGAALAAVARVLDARDGSARQLLVLDLSGPTPRAAVAVGDVDHAAHVAVVVPGFTTTVAGDLAGSDRLSSDLAALARREAMAWGDRGDVAVVSWLGYDAPQVADTLRPRSVVLRASAQAGADALGPFLRGLPPAVHLTVVAHSYGSTTAGLALAQAATGVDDLVAIGSPGLGVSSTAALGLSPAHVHVLEASDDPVADLGWFGRDPSRLPGVDRPSAEAAVLGDGTTGRRSVGHSTYLSPGTTSQWNIAAIVAGLPAAAGHPPAASSW